MLVLMQGRERQRDMEGERKMDNFRGLLVIRLIDGMLGAKVKELCNGKKGLDGRIDGSVLHLFVHTEKIGTKRVYKG